MTHLAVPFVVQVMLKYSASSEGSMYFPMENGASRFLIVFSRFRTSPGGDETLWVFQLCGCYGASPEQYAQDPGHDRSVRTPTSSRRSGDMAVVCRWWRALALKAIIVKPRDMITQMHHARARWCIGKCLARCLRVISSVTTQPENPSTALNHQLDERQ